MKPDKPFRLGTITVNIFLTSDSHFGHANILLFRTQFSSIEHHDETIIERWNAVIKPQDRVYHLGDVALGSAANARKNLDRLNGQIFLIRGNHDRVAEHRLCKDRFVWIKDYAKLKVDDQKLYMMHYPLLTWNCQHYGSYSLGGHGHRTTPDWPDCRRLDVGLDGHQMTPWSYEEVDLLLRNKPYPRDHHL